MEVALCFGYFSFLNDEGLLNPLKAPKSIHILISRIFSPKRVSSCRNTIFFFGNDIILFMDLDHGFVLFVCLDIWSCFQFITEKKNDA